MLEEEKQSLTTGLVEFCEKVNGWEGAVAKLGSLSLPQLRMICVIGRYQDIRMKDIADRLELTTGTVTVMIDRLQDMGLLLRHRHTTDRRSYVITLTEKGQAIYSEHRQRQHKLTERLFGRVDEDQRASFLRVIQQASSVLGQ